MAVDGLITMEDMDAVVNKAVAAVVMGTETISTTIAGKMVRRKKPRNLSGSCWTAKRRQRKSTSGSVNRRPTQEKTTTGQEYSG